MNGYLLDTNILIHLMSGKTALLARMQALGLNNCFISELTTAELLYGVAASAPERRAANRARNEQVLALFPNEQVLTVSTALPTYAEAKAHLRRLGRLQGEFDMLIASTALTQGLMLVTRNVRHFADVAGLVVENWVDGVAARP